jgi:hypothetical protein
MVHSRHKREEKVPSETSMQPPNEATKAVFIRKKNLVLISLVFLFIFDNYYQIID